MSPKQRLAGVLGASVVALAWPVIAQFEGTELVGYRDPVGIVTACRGHTAYAQLGKAYTLRDCDELQAADMWPHDAEMMDCVHVPLNDGQRAAFLSFTFNVGPAKFCQSTAAAKLNRGDYIGACKELGRWVYAGGQKLAGLVRRRAAEMALCMGTTV